MIFGYLDLTVLLKTRCTIHLLSRELSFHRGKSQGLRPDHLQQSQGESVAGVWRNVRVFEL